MDTNIQPSGSSVLLKSVAFGFFTAIFAVVFYAAIGCQIGLGLYAGSGNSGWCGFREIYFTPVYGVVGMVTYLIMSRVNIVGGKRAAMLLLCMLAVVVVTNIVLNIIILS